ncbi:MAG TPA: type VI secretion system tube protein Hcp [Polyangia bacterium]|jgi:type VI secretion system secreted protein Hcp
MAMDMFLKIDDLVGDSLDEKHPNEIQVLSWSWGMSQSGSTHAASGGGSGKVNVQDLTFMKNIDTTTTNLIKMCCSGNHFKHALLTVRKAGGKAAVEYLKIKMQDLIISNISTGGSGGSDLITESVTLNFAKVSVDYTPQDKTGAAGSVMSAAWNIPVNNDKC